MKPSERIKELIRAASRDGETDPVILCLRAIVGFLDEQAESPAGLLINGIVDGFNQAAAEDAETKGKR